MNRDSDRMTSWLKFDLTSTSNASMKCVTTSSETASPFIASSSLFTIPVSKGVSSLLLGLGLLND